MLAYLWMFIIGIVVGGLARLIMPGTQQMGLVMTGLLGVAGSFVGGFIARLFNGAEAGSMIQPSGIIMSVIGALILMFVYGKLKN